MLKEMLYNLTKSFMKTDCKTIVCHPGDGHLRISSTTDDKQLYIFAESIADGWDCKEFAFRDWQSVAQIISSFYGDTCEMKIEKDQEDYPNLLRIKNGSMKMTHYLQNYTFISRQDDLLNSYKGKKFTLKGADTNSFPDFTSDTMSKITKLSNLTGEKYFKIKKEGNDLYLTFGDESKTIDNGKILIQANYTAPFTDNNLYFSVDYFNIAVSSLKDQNMMIKFDGKSLQVSGQDDVSKKVMVILGKKEI